MRSIQPTTISSSSRPLYSCLDKLTFGTCSPFTRRTHRPARHRQSNFNFDQRDLRILDAVSTESETVLKQEGEEEFDWFKTWWPVQAVQNLPTDRPYRIQLLGKYYAVWKGHNGDWIAMDDECPHRLAPLSEGRIEDDGNLLCSYHAWRFNESGKCVKIPHAEDEKAHSVACSSSRSAVQTYPCKVKPANDYLLIMVLGTWCFIVDLA